MPTHDKPTTWRRDPNVPFQNMEEEAIVIHPKTREVHLLNETAARIWDLLEASHSIDELVDMLAEEYDAPPEALRLEVEAFVADLDGKGLVAAKGQA